MCPLMQHRAQGGRTRMGLASSAVERSDRSADPDPGRSPHCGSPAPAADAVGEDRGANKADAAPSPARPAPSPARSAPTPASSAPAPTTDAADGNATAPSAAAPSDPSPAGKRVRGRKCCATNGGGYCENDERLTHQWDLLRDVTRLDVLPLVTFPVIAVRRRTEHQD